jgi:hypothetical protein
MLELLDARKALGFRVRFYAFSPFKNSLRPEAFQARCQERSPSLCEIDGDFVLYSLLCL